MKFRKSLALILILTLCAAFLGGCYSEAAESSGETLWVVTEQSTSDGMNLQAQIIAERMEQAHPGLTIQLEILPLDRQERELRIKQLRTQIMSGKGPDVYLLPTGGETAIDYSYGRFREQMYIAMEPLFSDVSRAMRNEVFADIQPYYQADETLNTEGLKQEIMDAGIVNGSRYVLPLRFSMPVILTAPEDWSNCGLSAGILRSNPSRLAQWALSQADPRVAAGLQLPKDPSILPQPLDYDHESVRLSREEIAQYLRLYQSWGRTAERTASDLLDKWEERAIAYILEVNQDEKVRIDYMPQNRVIKWIMSRHSFDEFNSLRQYIDKGTYWRTEGMAFYVANLADSLESLGIAKYEGVRLEMFPLLTIDGSISASVSYFGAIGRSCETPELGYEFLRQFLKEEFQWDQYRPRVQKKGLITLGWPIERQTLGQVEDSWPVRAKGATPYLWSSVQYQVKGVWERFRESESKRVSLEIQQLQLTDEDIPALSWPIDEVRFPVTLPEEESLEHALSLLNEEDGTPTDADIDKLSQQVYQNLWFHLMEG